MNGDPISDPRVAAHLAAVAAVLARGGDAVANDRVLEHLRGHIREAVQARSGEPDAVAAVLAELDPPEDYRPAEASAPGAASARLGWWAFLAALAGPVLGLVVGLAGAAGDAPWLAFCAIELSALVAGIVAWRRPWGRTAVFAALGLFAAPLLLAALFPHR